MLGRRTHDDFADVPAAGVEDMVERTFQQFAGFLGPASDHAHGLGVKILRHEFGDEARGVGRKLGGLQADGVACGERVGHWFQSQQHRVIPWRDDEYHALGLGDRPAGGGLQHPMHRLGMARGPQSEPVADELRLAGHQIQLHQYGFRRGFAQIGHGRSHESITIVRYQTA